MTSPPLPEQQEPLPCPFCGEPVAIVQRRRDGLWLVECECEAKVLLEVPSYEAALSSWNTRAVSSPPLPREPSEQAVDAFFAKLDECGWRVSKPTRGHHVTNDLVRAVTAAYAVDARSPESPGDTAKEDANG